MDSSTSRKRSTTSFLSSCKSGVPSMRRTSFRSSCFVAHSTRKMPIFRRFPQLLMLNEGPSIRKAGSKPLQFRSIASVPPPPACLSHGSLLFSSAAIGLSTAVLGRPYQDFYFPICENIKEGIEDLLVKLKRTFNSLPALVNWNRSSSSSVPSSGTSTPIPSSPRPKLSEEQGGFLLKKLTYGEVSPASEGPYLPYADSYTFLHTLLVLSSLASSIAVPLFGLLVSLLGPFSFPH